MGIPQGLEHGDDGSVADFFLAYNKREESGSVSIVTLVVITNR